MTTLGIVLGIVGLVGAVFGIAFADDAPELALLGILACIICFPTFVITVIKNDNKVLRQGHREAVRDLKSAGWNVSWSDIHMNDEQVDIQCAKFGLHKLDGKYQVTVNRSASEGGGYIIEKPTIQPAVTGFCNKGAA